MRKLSAFEQNRAIIHKVVEIECEVGACVLLEKPAFYFLSFHSFEYAKQDYDGAEAADGQLLLFGV